MIQKELHDALRKETKEKKDNKMKTQRAKSNNIEKGDLITIMLSKKDKSCGLNANLFGIVLAIALPSRSVKVITEFGILAKNPRMILHGKPLWIPCTQYKKVNENTVVSQKLTTYSNQIKNGLFDEGKMTFVSAKLAHQRAYGFKKANTISNKCIMDGNGIEQLDDNKGSQRSVCRCKKSPLCGNMCGCRKKHIPCTIHCSCEGKCTNHTQDTSMHTDDTESKSLGSDDHSKMSVSHSLLGTKRKSPFQSNKGQTKLEKKKRKQTLLQTLLKKDQNTMNHMLEKNPDLMKLIMAFGDSSSSEENDTSISNHHPSPEIPDVILCGNCNDSSTMESDDLPGLKYD